MLMRAGPQDLPFSARLLNFLVILYVISGVVAFAGTIDTELAFINMIGDIMVMLFYTYLVLKTLNRKPRFLQTVTAMVGIGILFHLLAWPLLQQTQIIEGETVISPGASLLMLLLLSWSLLINAHIYRQALETGIVSAIMLSFALFFVSLAVSRFLMPEA